LFALRSGLILLSLVFLIAAVVVLQAIACAFHATITTNKIDTIITTV